MSKSNIRSFRYSDKVSQVLDGFQGVSLNDKFENLVLFCFDNVEFRKQELNKINAEISKKQSEYSKLCNDVRDLSSLIDTLKTIERYGEMALNKVKSISKE